jgi:predicted DNA-binding protein
MTRGKMTLPSKQLHVRLSPEMLKRFDELSSEFPSLQKAALLRLIIDSVLEHDKDQVAELILRQLRKPVGARKQVRPPSLNAKSRLPEG